MKTKDLLKYAFIRTGSSKAELALKAGVSETYVSYIAQRMDINFRHLLPKTDKSTKVQNAIKELIEPELILFTNNIQNQTA